MRLLEYRSRTGECRLRSPLTCDPDGQVIAEANGPGELVSIWSTNDGPKGGGDVTGSDRLRRYGQFVQVVEVAIFVIQNSGVVPCGWHPQPTRVRRDRNLFEGAKTVRRNQLRLLGDYLIKTKHG
jgi:hypothetical protein